MGEQEDLEREILQEFLVESAENLSRLDQEMVELEQDPTNSELLASIFRTIHTVKGTCGFLGFSRLEAVSHLAENILGEVRAGERRLDSALAGLILEAGDALRRILASIEAGAGEGPVFEEDLLVRLQIALTQEPPAPETALSPSPAIPVYLPVESFHESQQEAITQVSQVTPATHDVHLPPPSSVADSTLRVDVQHLDRLMNLVGELVLTRNQMMQQSAAIARADGDDNPIVAISQRLNLITSELQEGVMKTRMQPIGVVWNKLPRVVRDLAASLGKEVSLEMEGAGTELDRAIIEAIKDPLTHIVRNSCDHGIESPADRVRAGKSASGTLSLRAFHEGGKVHIEIQDDGAGIDPRRIRAKAVERGLISPEQASRLSERDAVNMVFLPGFSTAAEVTSISGRGVGMDVVKTNIDRIGGTIDLESKPGEGTVVRVTIPLTLAIVPGLVIYVDGRRYVIPQVNLHEVIWIDGDESQSRIEYIHTTPVFRQRDGLLPLANLGQILGVKPAATDGELCIIVVRAEGRRFGLLVDSVGDTEEIVVKPLGPLFEGISCYAGATIMGDGGIALILDVNGLGVRSGVLGSISEKALQQGDDSSKAAAEHTVSLLLVRAGNYPRLALPLGQVARLEQIPCSQVERAGGRDVVQYRDQILPLINVASVLTGAADFSSQEMLEVVVCRQGASAVGLVVDEVIDAVEEAVRSPRGERTRGLLGSAVIGGLVTDFLDLDALIALASPAISEEAQSGFKSLLAAYAHAGLLEAK